jgi:hypothetical protein
MSNNIWDQFMNRLVSEEGKLDEFCNLADADIDRWLVENDMGVTIDQLVKASPRLLSDLELDNVTGGKVTIYGLQAMVKTEGLKFKLN